MLDDAELDQVLRLHISRIMLALYRQGITRIHLGGLMRIIGVDNDRAALHDTEVVSIDAKFADYIESLEQPRPEAQALH